ncbi:unnamed protein product [Paramecium octaurelia]|uniref:Uncharacterized protein n=1 Tax=Paramecium octaurelia TaxID=43137 RepID=A0A8S1Y7U8_PAROT|nr:unnamed protein product [Paramecium octaurelia]
MTIKYQFCHPETYRNDQENIWTTYQKKKIHFEKRIRNQKYGIEINEINKKGSRRANPLKSEEYGLWILNPLNIGGANIKLIAGNWIDKLENCFKMMRNQTKSSTLKRKEAFQNT